MQKLKLISGLLCVGLLLASLALVRADAAPVRGAARLEDLGAELLKPSTSQSATPLDQRRLAQLGEDVAERRSAPDDRLSKVVGHMQTAQLLLERSDASDRASSAQAEALSGLDAMIAELKQQQSQCRGGQSRGGDGEKPGPPAPGKQPNPNGKAGKSPAQAAPATTSRGADLSTELAVAGELVKDLWGKLPQRQREQILQPLSEEFLPKYASEIEAYFRDLADPRPR